MEEVDENISYGWNPKYNSSGELTVTNLQTKAKTEVFDGVFSYVRELTNHQLEKNPYFLCKNISFF